MENSITQLAPGPCVFGGMIVSNGEVTAGRALVSVSAVGHTILKQGCTAFYVPLRWAGDLKFNGVSATPNTIHMPVEDVSYHIRGRERDLAGCILPGTRFVETIAALRGVDL